MLRPQAVRPVLMGGRTACPDAECHLDRLPLAPAGAHTLPPRPPCCGARRKGGRVWLLSGWSQCLHLLTDKGQTQMPPVVLAGGVSFGGAGAGSGNTPPGHGGRCEAHQQLGHGVGQSAGMWGLARGSGNPRGPRLGSRSACACAHGAGHRSTANACPGQVLTQDGQSPPQPRGHPVLLQGFHARNERPPSFSRRGEWGDEPEVILNVGHALRHPRAPHTPRNDSRDSTDAVTGATVPTDKPTPMTHV